MTTTQQEFGRPWSPWISVLSAAGRVVTWLALLFGLPVCVEMLAAAQPTPAVWRQLTLTGLVLYLATRLLRWPFRVGKTATHVADAAAVSMVLDPEVAPALARHEAAHAVVAHKIGARVNLVTIVPNSRSWGHNDVDLGSSCGAADGLFNLMTVCMASVIVEADQLAACAKSDVGPSEDVTRTVVAAARIVALGVAPTDFQGALSVDQLVAAAASRARHLLGEHESAVAAIADALVEERTLDADRVAQLVEAVAA